MAADTQSDAPLPEAPFAQLFWTQPALLLWAENFVQYLTSDGPSARLPPPKVANITDIQRRAIRLYTASAGLILAGHPLPDWLAEQLRVSWIECVTELRGQGIFLPEDSPTLTPPTITSVHEQVAWQLALSTT